jgi:hypothetical protein
MSHLIATITPPVWYFLAACAGMILFVIIPLSVTRMDP